MNTPPGRALRPAPARLAASDERVQNLGQVFAREAMVQQMPALQQQCCNRRPNAGAGGRERRVQPLAAGLRSA